MTQSDFDALDLEAQAELLNSLGIPASLAGDLARWGQEVPANYDHCREAIEAITCYTMVDFERFPTS